MKNRRLGITCLLITALLFGMVGCGKNDAAQTESDGASAEGNAAVDYRLPEVKEDYFALFCQNTDVTFNQYSCSNNIAFTVLSAKPLTADNATVTFSGNVPVTYEWCMNDKPEELPLNLFICYQGVDLVELEQLLTDGNMEEYHKIMDSLNEAYDNLSADEIPTLYTGNLLLQIPDPTRLDGGTLGTMTVATADQRVEYPLDALTYSQVNDIKEDSGELFCDTISLTDINMDPSESGKFRFDNINLTAQADTAIEKIYFLNAPDTQIDAVSVTQTQGETTMDFLWDASEPLTLAKDETVQISVEAHDPIFANTMSANATRYLVIAYRGAEGTGETFVELTFRMRQNGFWTYGELEDGISMLPYYEFLANSESE